MQLNGSLLRNSAKKSLLVFHLRPAMPSHLLGTRRWEGSGGVRIIRGTINIILNLKCIFFNNFHLRWKTTWTQAPRLNPGQSETFAKDFWNWFSWIPLIWSLRKQNNQTCSSPLLSCQFDQSCSRTWRCSARSRPPTTRLQFYGENISGRNICLTFWMRMTTMAVRNIDFATAED